MALVRGERLAFRQVFLLVRQHRLCQALDSARFGVISIFITLFYVSHAWRGAAWALSNFGSAFIAVRLLCPELILRCGGFPVAIASFAVECAG